MNQRKEPTMLTSEQLDSIEARRLLWLENVGPTALDPKECLLETHIPALIAQAREALALREENERLLSLLNRVNNAITNADAYDEIIIGRELAQAIERLFP